MKFGVHDLMLREHGKTNQEVFADTKKLVKVGLVHSAL